MLAGSRPMDLPQMLRPMAPAERADWLSLHGVPHIVQARMHSEALLLIDTLAAQLDKSIYLRGRVLPWHV